MLFIVSTYLASSFCYLRSRIFNNKKKRRMILSLHDESANDKDIKYILDEIINQVCLAKEDDCEKASHENDISANDISANDISANIYEIDVNMEDSWSLEYGIDHVKIYHCHIPIMSNDSDNDDF